MKLLSFFFVILFMSNVDASEKVFHDFKIEYISVDVGPERGIDQKSTDSEVTTFLTKNNFKLITENTNRKSKLFQNKH